MLEDEAFSEKVNKRVFSYFYPEYLGKDYLIGAFDKERLCGLVQFGENPYRKEKTYTMKFVSVIQEYRNQGVAKKLIEEMIKDLIGKTDIIELSSYVESGFVLVNTAKGLAQKYPDITIMHKKNSDPYQNAINHYIETGMTVKIDDPTQNLVGVGEVITFIEYSNPLKVYVKLNDQSYEVDCKYLIPQ